MRESGAVKDPETSLFRSVRPGRDSFRTHAANPHTQLKHRVFLTAIGMRTEIVRQVRSPRGKSCRGGFCCIPISSPSLSSTRADNPTSA